MAELDVTLTPTPQDKLVGTITATPQNIPVTDNQVRNNAGGYIFSISPLERLKRFLILGTESSTYYQGKEELQIENLKNVLTCIRDYPEETIQITVESSVNGTALKPAYPIAVLALMWCYGDRKLVVNNATLILRTLSHLMLFLKYLKDINGGKLKTSRSLRRLVNTFFTKYDIDWIAYQTLKYRNRSGWRVTDIMRITHPEPNTPDLQNYFAWLFSISGGQPKVQVDMSRLPQIVRDFSTLYEYGQRYGETSTVDEELVNNVIQIIRNNKHITWEMIPNEFMRNERVWLELVNQIPYTALLRNVNRILKSFDFTRFIEILARRLDNEEAIIRARVNPMQIFIATETITETMEKISGETLYCNGNKDLQEVYFDTLKRALFSAFRKSFRAIPVSDKKLFIAIDASGSMYATFKGNTRYVDIAFVIAAILKRYFPQSIVFVFSSVKQLMWSNVYAPAKSHTKRTDDKETILNILNIQALKNYFAENKGLMYVDINPDQVDDITSIKKIIRTLSTSDYDGTDCSLPFMFAYTQEVFDIDGFVTITDNETWSGIIHPFEALKIYRTVKNDAKSIVLAMTSTGFSIADPNDQYSIDIAGFSPEITTVIAKFVDSTLNYSSSDEEE